MSSGRFARKLKPRGPARQLLRRKPKVEEDAVHGREAALPADAFDLAEVGLHQRHGALEAGQADPGALERLRVGVDAEQGRRRATPPRGWPRRGRRRSTVQST